jgi:hypothetical protein
MKSLKIPKYIFQTWETKDISDGFKTLIQSWKDNNPNYTHVFLDDNERREIIKQNFHERVYNTYCKIIPGAFRADLWRYCMLYIYGGVYVDIDTICYSNLDDFLSEDIEFMTPIDLNNCSYLGTYNLSNGFIVSIPKHPILLNCIERIVYNVENNIVPFSNLDFSGPGVLGKSTNTFLNLNEESSFIGKQGITNNIKFLKFEYGSEYVKDIENNNILFQNKNGNTQIQEIYNNEIKTIDYVCWGKCKNPIKQEINETINNVTTIINQPTIVTMLYDIREKEGNKTNSPLNRGIKKYCELAKKFILSLPYNLIVFTDNEEVIELIETQRGDLKNKTHIYKRKFEETYFYKYMDKLYELQKQFHIINGNIEQETPMYIILNNNKFDCMEKSIELNPFNSSHFVWMDFGINHVAKNTELIHDWIFKVPDKIKQLCINPYIENINPKKYFELIYHNCAGGLFSGSKENLIKYIELFKQKTEQIYNEDWYQIDEAVMTMVQRENYHLFDFFYGDYEGIVSNYLKPIHSWWLINLDIQKCLNFNNMEYLYNMLVYLDSHYIIEDNQHGDDFYKYINNNIICNYYQNNRCLRNVIINLINIKISKNDEKIKNILISNKEKIDLYLNKNLIMV